MKINWSFIEPVRDQAARLRGDFTVKSEIVKLAEQQVEIERLRKENADLREALEGLQELIARKYKIRTEADPDDFFIDQEGALRVSDLRAARAAIREGEK